MRFLRCARNDSLSGFTLIEVVISIGILIIVLLPLTLMLAGGSGRSKYGGLVIARRQANLNKCLFFAERMLEQHKSIAVNNWSDAKVQNGTSPAITYDTDTDFRYSTTISDALTDGGVVARVKRIGVTVWKEEILPTTYPPQDGEDVITLYTRVTRRGTW